MTAVITHSVSAGGVVDSTAAVDGAAWDANHVITGVMTPAQGGTGVINNDASTITISGAFGTTFTVTATTSLTLPTTGTLATTSDKLSAFAATTSAELAGVISDETGSGALVFATSPTLVTPTLGVATATSLTASGQIKSTFAGAGPGAGLFSQSTSPALCLQKTDGGADAKNWDVAAFTNALHIRAINDANSVAADAVIVRRSGATITEIEIPNSIEIPDTGNFYAADGARIQRMNDRVFIGGAADASGEQVAAQGDWLTTWQRNHGAAYGYLQTSTSAILMNSVHDNELEALTVGAQTLGTITGGNAIGVSSFGVGNKLSDAVHGYAFYGEGHRGVGSIGGAYGIEVDTVNFESSVTIDPFAQSATQTIGVQVASGGDVYSSVFNDSAAINIRSNGAKFNTGIVFGNDAINGTDGSTGEGDAIAMATGHVINYYYAAGSVSWGLRASFGVNGDYSVTTSGTGAFSVPRLKTNTVKFPATQVPSSDANTLDDYEEGTFTPTVAFSAASTGVTYSKQAGKYTKIGNVVNFAVDIILTSKGSSTGSMTITSLPFAVSSAVNVAANVRLNNLAAGVSGDLQAACLAGLTEINIIKFAAGTGTQLADTDVTNTSVIRIAGSYFVD